MMYLIKKNDKYLVMASDVETIRKYCGIDAKIVFSWKEEDQKTALNSFFSRMRIDADLIDLCAVSGITKDDINKYIDGYYEQDEKILESLTDIDVITSEEKDELSEISVESKKKQLDLVSESYFKNPSSKAIRGR